MNHHPDPSDAIRAARRWWRADEGRVTAFVVVLTTALIGLAGLTLDGGRALAAKVEAIGQAESAARAGADAIDLATYRTTGATVLLPVQAVARAQTYLAQVGATGTVTIDDQIVTVAVTTTTDTQLLGLVGISSLRVSATGSARPRHGVLTPNP
jgi:hypothetical protein